MTDQTLADQLRPILDEWERIKEDAEWVDMDNLVQELRALLPIPTLADMTPDEQAECAGMQADLAQGDRVLILDGTPGYDGRVQVLESSLDVYRPVAALVTPRPDLPRLEWPGDTPTPAAPIDQEDYPPRDQLTLGGKWADITKLEEALRQKGEAADQAIVIDDEGDVHVWEIIGGGGWMARVPVQQCGPFRLILNDQEADQ